MKSLPRSPLLRGRGGLFFALTPRRSGPPGTSSSPRGRSRGQQTRQPRHPERSTSGPTDWTGARSDRSPFVYGLEIPVSGLEEVRSVPGRQAGSAGTLSRGRRSPVSRLAGPELDPRDGGMKLSPRRPGPGAPPLVPRNALEVNEPGGILAGAFWVDRWRAPDRVAGGSGRPRDRKLPRASGKLLSRDLDRSQLTGAPARLYGLVVLVCVEIEEIVRVEGPAANRGRGQ